jgi:hypothetical protein
MPARLSQSHRVFPLNPEKELAFGRYPTAIIAMAVTNPTPRMILFLSFFFML